MNEIKFIEIPVKTIYMQMTSRPLNAIAKPDGAEIIYETKPEINWYKDIYHKVGSKWGWAKRLTFSDEELKNTIRSKDVEIYYLSVDKEVAGFFEYERKGKETEIVYLGLVPQFIGKGLGQYLLNQAINMAWDIDIERLTLHTCEYDHISALKLYQKLGFQIYDKRIDNEYYTEEFLKDCTKIENFF